MAQLLSRIFAISLFAAVALAQAGSCPAGRGYPNEKHRTCVTCGKGTYSEQGSTECTRCPPGTWSSVEGAVDVGTCTKCPRGTWSSQEGSPTEDSCQGCTPGRWGGSTGLGSDLQCTACAAGSWSNEHGATSGEVCQQCPEGTWSPQQAATAQSQCINCAPGTWSDARGASKQSSCQKCPKGTWSTEWGATAVSTCMACPVGTYQPAVGQANVTNCIECPPGKYGALTGASTCALCPGGSWTAEFNQTACTICPQGQWMSAEGSRLQGNCRTCRESSDCLPDASVRVTVEFRGLPAAVPEELRAALAEDLASACGVNNESVVDLQGHNASVSVDAEGILSAFVLGLQGTSANELSARLYSASFRGELADSVAVFLADDAGVSAGAISVQPEQFVPLEPTTSTETLTTTSISAPATTPGYHPDMQPEEDLPLTAAAVARTSTLGLAGLLLATSTCRSCP